MSVEEDQMASFTNAVAAADESREAVRGLAHATRRFADPADVYSVLGSLTQTLGSLTQVLHQLGDFHDGTAGGLARVEGDARQGRAVSYQVAWELHRAAEMVHQVGTAVDRAQQSEATLAYDVSELPRLVYVASHTPHRGLSL